MNNFVLLLVCVNVKVLVVNVFSLSSHPIFVVIGFDGFRQEYLQRGTNPVLLDMIKNGSTTVRLKNQFPTLTFPNFYSISTGMYPETHGVLGKNTFSRNGICIDKYEELLFSYNKDITPIWTLNELSGEGRHSGVMMWLSSEFGNHDIFPTFLQKYEPKMPWKERVDKATSWLIHDETPANLVLMYFEEPDSTGHYQGPYSDNMTKTLERVDEIVSHYLQRLREYNISDRVNTIILSDHGMTMISNATLINLNGALNPNEYTSCGSTPVKQIWPKPGFENKVLEQLIRLSKETKNFDVYKRNAIPDDWHLKNNDAQAPLLLVAKEPYIFEDSLGSGGAHGYDRDDPDMFPIFIAQGPAFKKSCIVSSFENIDIYPLISHVLRLKSPQVPVNGSLSNIESILIQSSDKKPVNFYILVIFSCIILGVIILTIIFLFLKNNNGATKLHSEFDSDSIILDSITLPASDNVASDHER